MFNSVHGNEMPDGAHTGTAFKVILIHVVRSNGTTNILMLQLFYMSYCQNEGEIEIQVTRNKLKEMFLFFKKCLLYFLLRVIQEDQYHFYLSVLSIILEQIQAGDN